MLRITLLTIILSVSIPSIYASTEERNTQPLRACPTIDLATLKDSVKYGNENRGKVQINLGDANTFNDYSFTWYISATDANRLPNTGKTQQDGWTDTRPEGRRKPALLRCYYKAENGEKFHLTGAYTWTPFAMSLEAFANLHED